MTTPDPAEPHVPCFSCGEPVHARARYCPSCGAYRNPSRDRSSRRRSEGRRLRQAILVLALYFAQLGVILPLHWVSEEHLVTAIMVASVGLALLTIGFVPFMPVGLRALLAPTRASPRWILIGVSALLLVLALNFGYHHLLLEALGAESVDPREVWNQAGVSLAVQVLFICAFPAVFEEIAFRGLVQGSLAQLIGGRGAVLVSAILFATIHRAFLSMPILLLIGVVIGILRRRSGSLYPGMVFHGLHNLAVLLIVV